MPILHINISGALHTRCITDASDGRMCQFVRTSHFGTRWHCHLFDKELKDESGTPSGAGCLQRLPECLSAEQQ